MKKVEGFIVGCPELSDRRPLSVWQGLDRKAAIHLSIVWKAVYPWFESKRMEG